jgi:deoxyribonuclease V
MDIISMKSILKSPQSIEQAIRLQRQWAGEVKTSQKLIDIKTIAGVDVAYTKDKAFACVCVLDYESLELIESQKIVCDIPFPYYSGLLSFREAPVIIKAIEKLSKLPDCLVCDGQGIAHPRGFGLACHLGVALDIPSIGCAKSRLYGKAKEPGVKKGDSEPLMRYDEVIGCVLRTRDRVKPLYVSVGHKISLTQACHCVLHLCPKYRLPETTRIADSMVSKMKLISKK